MLGNNKIGHEDAIWIAQPEGLIFHAVGSHSKGPSLHFSGKGGTPLKDCHLKYCIKERESQNNISGISIGVGVWPESKPHLLNKLNYVPSDVPLSERIAAGFHN
jgi:hypothetical protein